MLNAEWIEPDRIMVIGSGTHGIEPGMVIQLDNERYWVVQVLNDWNVEVLKEIDLKVSASSPDKFPIWRLMLLILMIYFIVRVLL